MSEKEFATINGKNVLESPGAYDYERERQSVASSILDKKKHSIRDVLYPEVLKTSAIAGIAPKMVVNELLLYIKEQENI
ncbi:MAG: hypothetical protein LBG88_03715 [Christensenellaceae bacterium]|jgi:hypothetical protein|nr:hypothetical protein [Christensenellaceae bacterium]